ncbi:MAG: hypothetical protein H7Y38_19260 [Armatimonadetes bacterium]|nr:hypothetical protein [Armatimonadota bacterium]
MKTLIANRVSPLGVTASRAAVKTLFRMVATERSGAAFGYVAQFQSHAKGHQRRYCRRMLSVISTATESPRRVS